MTYDKLRSGTRCYHFWLAVFFLPGLLWGCGATPEQSTPAPLKPPQRETGEADHRARSQSELPERAVVARVIDGDTLELEGGEKVRLIGVDTPETVHPSRPVEAFGKEASAFTRSALEGEAIRLEYDQANSAGGHRDRYGRILAYVYRERDGLDFNAELVRQGFAHAYTSYPFRRMEEFRRYEREARDAGRGLWGAADTTVRGSQSTEEDSTVYVTRTGKKFHRSNCRYLKYSKIPLPLSEARLRYSPCSVCGPTAYESRATERPGSGVRRFSPRFNFPTLMFE